MFNNVLVLDLTNTRDANKINAQINIVYIRAVLHLCVSAIRDINPIFHTTFLKKNKVKIYR